MHVKAQPLPAHYAQQKPSFSFIYGVIDERRKGITKNDNVKHSSQSGKDTFSTVHTQTMLTFSTVISYFHTISLMRVFQ